MFYSWTLRCDLQVLFIPRRHHLENNSKFCKTNFCERQTAVSEILGFSEILCWLYMPFLFLQKIVDLNASKIISSLKLPIVLFLNFLLFYSMRILLGFWCQIQQPNRHKALSWCLISQWQTWALTLYSLTCSSSFALQF